MVGIGQGLHINLHMIRLGITMFGTLAIMEALKKEMFGDMILV